MSFKISVAGKTDLGLVRSGNEDSLRIDLENNLFLVCDGMGGHQAGEVASRTACEIITQCFGELSTELAGDSALAIPAEFPSRGDLLVKSIRLANRNIYMRSRSRSDLTGMGTTVVAVALQDGLINIAHVGDSRVYRLLPTGLVPLTTDHSWVAELKQSGQFSEEEASQIVGKNVITRALGVNERVEIDFRADRITPGEIYLLCTDGLCGYADDEEIFKAANGCHGDVNLIVDILVQLANEHGGQDNVSAVALKIDEVESGEALSAVSPVTVSVESDEGLLRENQILDTLSKREEQARQILTPEEPPVKSRSLAWIFAAFIIVAVLIIYFFAR